MGLRERKWQENEENYTLRSFIICDTRLILLCDVIIEKKVVAACSTHGREDRYSTYRVW
jgi:hypothetical protein